ncbi:MFS transporter [Pseudaminobacter sp. NGMCC 1.201702]|uniref:MFS transporter n=1 Tax=Pseudaminobacter sp. NGMCC 1.201702 TaxID=3391825 RepID=UPI0039EE1FDD
MAGIVTLAFAYVLSQFYRTFLAVLTPVLSAELDATKGDLSAASGAFFLSFALAQFAIGVWLDRYGPKRTTAAMLAACGGGGALLFAAASTPWMVTVAMGLIGFGCAPVLMAAVFIFARIYPPARFAVLTSWMVAFGTAGNVIGASPLANAAEAFGWRLVMAGLGLITLLAAVAIFALVRDPEKPAEMQAGSTGLSGYVELLRLKVLWPIIPLAAIAYAPSVGIRGLWAGPYLADLYGADTILIGEVTLFMALSMVAGAFVYGPLDQIFKTRKWVAVGGGLVSLLSISWLALNPVTSLTLATIVLVLIGISGGSYGLIMAHARAFLPVHLIGRGVTLMNFFTIGGVGLMQFATGGVVTASHVPGAPEAAYVMLFAFYAAMLASALLIYLFARDARPDKGVIAL